MVVCDLAVVTYLWSPDSPAKFGKHRYGPDDVRVLQRMVARNLSVPHDFVVVTDWPEAFADDSAIRAVPIDWTKHIPGTCYVRLMTFSPQAELLLGKRVLQIDLDSVIVGSLDHLVARDEDLVLWRNPRRWCLTDPDAGYALKLALFNGSILLHRSGTWTQMWSDFDPSCPLARDDQWWFSFRAGPGCPYWDGSHGVYRLAHVDRPWSGVGVALPENACFVTFPGDTAKPWQPETIDAYPWIAEHRR